jgi:hypothetical protein
MAVISLVKNKIGPWKNTSAAGVVAAFTPVIQHCKEKYNVWTRYLGP